MRSALRALITRPEEDAAPLAAALGRRGIDCLIEPMLRIVPVAAPSLDLTGVQALVITSANGARAFAAASPRRDLPVYAVGDASAAAARGLGFARVESAAGDVAALAAVGRRRADPAAGPLMPPVGRVSAGDLAGRLGALGFTLRRSVLYEAKPAQGFSATLEAALRRLVAGDGDAPAAGLRWVMFFSPRSAAVFVGLARAAGLMAAGRRLKALCLSRNVAEAAAAIDWRTIAVAVRPEQEALLALIDRDLDVAQKRRSRAAGGERSAGHRDA
ncbi:MAG: uroporphyrinogen-III synthase [Kiloniellales bacterium]